jgi:hypothetical protein
MEAAGGGIEPTFASIGRAAYAIDHIYVSPSLRHVLTYAELVRAEGFWSEGPQRDGLWVHSDYLPLTAELALGG